MALKNGNLGQGVSQANQWVKCYQVTSEANGCLTSTVGFSFLNNNSSNANIKLARSQNDQPQASEIIEIETLKPEFRYVNDVTHVMSPGEKLLLFSDVGGVNYLIQGNEDSTPS